MLVAFHSVGQKAGKNTAGGFVEEWCQEKKVVCHRTAFGDQMKMLCCLSLGIPVTSVEEAVDIMDQFKFMGRVGWTKKGLVPTPPFIDGRDYIINLAEGCRRLFGANFWVDQVLPPNRYQHQDLFPGGHADVMAITDLRFHEEAVRVHDYGGWVIKIIRDSAENQGGRSEEGLPQTDYDFVIFNNGTLDEFRREVQNFCDHTYGHDSLHG